MQIVTIEISIHITLCKADIAIKSKTTKKTAMVNLHLYIWQLTISIYFFYPVWVAY